MSVEAKNDIGQKPYSSDKSPLLHSHSTPEISLCRNKGKNKNTFSVRHSNTLDEVTLPYFLGCKVESKDESKKSDHRTSYVRDNLDCNPFESQFKQDMAAMSVVDLYQCAENLESKMHTDSDIMEETESDNKIEITEDAQKSNCDIPNHLEANESPSRKQSSQSCNAIKCSKPKIFFRDDVRSVDFVLVWDAFDEESVTVLSYSKRQIFESNLLKEGLELEHEPQEQNGLNFVKIHAPREVLRRYSEILKLRMPMKEFPALRQVSTHTNVLMKEINNQWDKIKSWVFVDKKTFPDKAYRFTAIYSRDREYLFDVDSPCFFTPAVHSRIVQFILDRKRFSTNLQSDFAFGIERLLNEKAYVAAYPLHDGDLKTPGSTRNLLYTEWASIPKWYRYQPLDYIKEYFGVKIALYFAWLGYYTHILLPAALVGLACFIYSCSTLYSNQPSEDICGEKIKEKMCPFCDGWCGYWDIKESCVHARITYLFDNATTVFFAVFMSVWATLFLELWKRYSAEITHRWDVSGIDVQEEHPRPQYLARLSHVKRKQVNIVTNTEEPYVPFWSLRVPMTIFSFSVVLLLVTLALATVVAVVLYRMAVLFSLKAVNKNAEVVDNSTAMIFTTCTAACINLVFILIFNYLYTFVAEYLTEFELLRTQTEFDDSLTLKIYLLQFVNYYASIFYIAFFKGRFVGHPSNYRKIFGYRQEECGPGGCLMELCIQLAVIMVGKQAMNTVLEMVFPLFFKWLNTLKVKTGLTDKGTPACKGCQPQWLRDFKLVEWGHRSLFPEYLEMVLQYGFVTIFVAAFPLAPFFALLNNILEMRLDARKLLTFYRRPVSQRVRDIGVWYRILDSIGKLSVVTNGFIIAFTSEFIPKLVYIAQHHSLDNYLNNSLSYFNTSDFDITSSKPPSWQSEKVCRYPDYREPPDSPNKYERSHLYWQIMAARLAFVVVFENIVVFVMIFVKWCIADVPEELRDQIRRETYITNEIIIRQEAIRAQSGCLRPSRKKAEKLRTIDEAPSTPAQWDRIISKSLSNSEFDLLVHDTERGDLGPSDQKSPSSV